MQSLGNYLKSGREAKNIRLSEVAQSTKISKWYLDCLEKDEFDKIPGGPYIKGYITSYASFIGLEEEEILRRYDSLQIDNDDENETQEQPATDKKRHKLISFSLRGKKLALLSMAALFLLAFGIYYFFFQKQTHIIAQLPDVQHSKKQSTHSSKIKQGETRPTQNDSSVQPAEINDFTEKVAHKFQKKQETGGASQSTDLSKETHLDPLKTGSESIQTNHDATGMESLALLPSKPEVEGTSKASPVAKNEIRTTKTTGKEPVIHHELQLTKNDTVKQNAPVKSNNTSHHGTIQSAASDLGSVPTYQAPDAQYLATNNIKVIKAVATSEIKNRNPKERGNSFPWSTERVYIWSMVECERPPSSIRHTYYFKGQKVNDIVLKIKSPQWRTWSYKTLLDKRWIGQWTVDITSLEGELLQRIFFDVN
jgi:cytoskeletal protein RodZ